MIFFRTVPAGFKSSALVAFAIGALAAPAAFANATVDEAVAAIKAGQFTRAEDLLMPLVEQRHADAAVLYNMAIVRMAQKQNDDAIKYAERATKADPTNPEYFLRLSAACNARIAEVGPMEGGALATKMRKADEKALDLDPNNLPALLGLLLFYERAPEIVGGSEKKAREVAQRIRKFDPYQGELALGRLASGLKNYDEALLHYDAAAKLRPDDLATATACGWTLFALGRNAEARARFEAVLKINSDFGPAVMGMAKTAPPAP